MPSFKLIAGLGLILAFGLSLLYAQRSGLAQGRAEGDAKYNRLVAQHANTVAAAVEDARQQAEAQAAKRQKDETALAIKDEARVAPRQARVDATLRAQRDAEHADETFARCLALPLPDGLRRDPPGPGTPTG